MHWFWWRFTRESSQSHRIFHLHDWRRLTTCLPTKFLPSQRRNWPPNLLNSHADSSLPLLDLIDISRRGRVNFHPFWSAVYNLMTSGSLFSLAVCSWHIAIKVFYFVWFAQYWLVISSSRCSPYSFWGCPLPPVPFISFLSSTLSNFFFPHPSVFRKSSQPDL